LFFPTMYLLDGKYSSEGLTSISWQEFPSRVYPRRQKPSAVFHKRAVRKYRANSLHNQHYSPVFPHQ
jgi:hypothetical protein